MQVINTPRDHVLGILMGETRKAVERRLLLMLGGFFDGSGPGHSNGRYVMAGFVSFSVTWSEIAERWQKTLDLKPSIPKFKLALSRDPVWRGQFRISKDQMESRIKKLSALVTPPKTLFSVVCSIDERDFESVMESTKVRGNKPLRRALGKYAFTTPYMLLFHNVIARTLWKVHHLGICGDQVDFVFDRENRLFDNANAILRKMRPNLPAPLNGLLGDAVWRDEDNLKPLQAADLIAGIAKDQCNDPGNIKRRKAVVSLAREGEHNTTLHYEKRNIQELVDRLIAVPSENPLFDRSV